MTTITVPTRLMRPVATWPARRAVLIGFVATLLSGIVAAAALSLTVAAAPAGTVLPGLTVGGVDIGGLDRTAAAQRLTDALPAMEAGEAIVVVDGEPRVIPFDELGRQYELEAMVDAALALGRAEHPLTDAIARLRNLANPASLPLLVHQYDRDRLDAVAAAIAARATTGAVDATVTRTGATFTVHPSLPGTSLEAEDVRAALATALDSTSANDVTVELTPAIIGPDVETADAEAAAQVARDTAQALALEIPGASEGEEPLAIGAETIASWLSFGPDGGTAYALHVDDAAAAAAVEALAASINRDPVNAHITVAAGGGLGGVIAAQDGRALAVEDSTDAVLEALERRGSGAAVASLPLVVDVTQPAVTTAHAESVLPQMQMISSWTTYYVPGEGNGWGNNINIPAWDIDGKNLAPGETFSFWGSVGPFTVERGFMYGGAIINGRSTQGVAIGGGVCSTSTTVFNAALRAGLEMGIRLNHYYYIDRYPDGLDATVSIMDGWAQDITFRNDTENPIVVRGFGGSGSVTFQIWSVPLQRTVVITDPVTWNHRRASDTTIVDPSMAPGTARRVEYPHDGHDVSRSRYVYDAAGNLLHQDDYFSSYATVTGITVVGPSAAE
jgi:vancomycin resistance protein YoaR